MSDYTLPFSRIPAFSKFDKAYSETPQIFQDFYKYPPSLSSFGNIFSDKINDKTDRKTLVDALERQYSKMKQVDPTVKRNITALLGENIFTVTTAHQPSLFLGPLFFIYKILSTIRLANDLNQRFPNWYVIPVFVIGGEDHDFEEVNHINLFNKKIIWENDEHGAVGMMHTASLKSALEELKTLVGESENAVRIYEIIHRCYTEYDIYQDATQALIHELFGRFGLIVLNMNDATLKKLFTPLMEKELLNQPSKALIEKTQASLSALGFKAQAYPREINLFYLRDGLRERIVEQNGVYEALNTKYHWSKDEIIAHLNEYPQYFSPNVALRPLYQETVLPNLAYIGGGGELAYWLERKAQFEYFGVNFPMLIRRNSVVLLDKTAIDKMQKLSVGIEDLASDIETAVKKYVDKSSSVDLHFEEEKATIAKMFDQVLAKVQIVDPTLEKTVLAERTKQVQSLEQLEAKIMKAEKQKQETQINQIRSLSGKFFPSGGLQERVENFLPYYIKYGDSLFDALLEKLDPFIPGLMVVSDLSG